MNGSPLGMRRRRATALVILALVHAWSCAPWRSGEAWSFALSREAFESYGEPGDESVASTYGDHPIRGGVESLWLLGAVTLPLSLALVLDACALPVTLSHDGWLCVRE